VAEQMTKTANRFDHEILLLQGGGALGAYNAGVYEGVAEAGHVPTWVVGVSIGAITAALIAGNPPERRVERLRAFWERVSSYAPVSMAGLARPHSARIRFPERGPPGRLARRPRQEEPSIWGSWLVTVP
jgi:predicted acylesterase/phospholipase RssA